jgi:hypothetical protein
MCTPSKAEIRDCCRQIRQTWSPRERLKRMAPGDRNGRVQVLIVAVNHWSVAIRDDDENMYREV